jgi:hypothetical protein
MSGARATGGAGGKAATSGKKSLARGPGGGQTGRESHATIGAHLRTATIDPAESLHGGFGDIHMSALYVPLIAAALYDASKFAHQPPARRITEQEMQRVLEVNHIPPSLLEEQYFLQLRKATTDYLISPAGLANLTVDPVVKATRKAQYFKEELQQPIMAPVIEPIERKIDAIIPFHTWCMTTIDNLTRAARPIDAIRSESAAATGATHLSGIGQPPSVIPCIHCGSTESTTASYVCPNCRKDRRILHKSEESEDNRALSFATVVAGGKGGAAEKKTQSTSKSKSGSRSTAGKSSTTKQSAAAKSGDKQIEKGTEQQSTSKKSSSKSRPAPGDSVLVRLRYKAWQNPVTGESPPQENVVMNRVPFHLTVYELYRTEFVRGIMPDYPDLSNLGVDRVVEFWLQSDHPDPAKRFLGAAADLPSFRTVHADATITPPAPVLSDLPWIEDAANHTYVLPLTLSWDVVKADSISAQGYKPAAGPVGRVRFIATLESNIQANAKRRMQTTPILSVGSMTELATSTDSDLRALANRIVAGSAPAAVAAGSSWPQPIEEGATVTASATGKGKARHTTPHPSKRRTKSVKREEKKEAEEQEKEDEEAGEVEKGSGGSTKAPFDPTVISTARMDEVRTKLSNSTPFAPWILDAVFRSDAPDPALHQKYSSDAFPETDVEKGVLELVRRMGYGGTRGKLRGGEGMYDRAYRVFRAYDRDIQNQFRRLYENEMATVQAERIGRERDELDDEARIVEEIKKPKKQDRSDKKTAAAKQSKSSASSTSSAAGGMLTLNAIPLLQPHSRTKLGNEQGAWTREFISGNATVRTSADSLNSSGMAGVFRDRLLLSDSMFAQPPVMSTHNRWGTIKVQYAHPNATHRFDQAITASPHFADADTPIRIAMRYQVGDSRNSARGYIAMDQNLYLFLTGFVSSRQSFNITAWRATTRVFIY